MKIFRSKKSPSTTEGVIELAQSIDRFEGYVLNHATEMARIAQQLAQRLGVSGADLNAIKLAALLHDSGQMHGKMQFIQSPQVFDFRQRVELWRHPLLSEQFVAQKGLPRQVQLLVRWHHEWWNGSGYPDMLAGEAIPLGARIIRLLDSYSALRCARPHRAAYSEEETINIITEHAGLEFDPVIVREFLAMLGYLVTAEVAIAENDAERALNPTVDKSLDTTLVTTSDANIAATLIEDSVAPPSEVAATRRVTDDLALPFMTYSPADAPTADLETDFLPEDLLADSARDHDDDYLPDPFSKSMAPTQEFTESAALDSALLANYTSSSIADSVNNNATKQIAALDPADQLRQTNDLPTSATLDPTSIHYPVARTDSAKANLGLDATTQPPAATTPLNEAYDPLAFANQFANQAPQPPPPPLPVTPSPSGTLPLTSEPNLLKKFPQPPNFSQDKRDDDLNLGPPEQ
jgi:putative nucleotidyltransferase with HDIG domain